MDRKSTDDRLNPLLPLLLAGALVLSAPLELAAQVPVDEYGEPLGALDDEGYDGPALAGATVENILPPLTPSELEDLVGPIALYPDDLLAVVLPASTYPLEIVQAARFLDDLGTDGSLRPDESWDESVIALLNYPEVVHMMDVEIDWTWRLGEAVISQQSDVITAVESFRDRAYAAGNLESDERQTVSNNNGVIEIEPVDEEIIYVPYYEPEEVVVYQPRRVYYYHPYAYPVYYYPYPYGYSFASGYFWGVTTAYTIGWSNHYLNVHHPSYWGHPYYGRHYYGHYYRRPSLSVYNSWYVHNSHRSATIRHRDGDQWRPRHRSGARPATQRVRNYHYSGGDRDNNPSNYRSSNRTRHDVRDRNPTGLRVNNNAGSRSGGATNRSRQSAAGTRVPTAVVERDTDRRERTDRTAIRFRERSESGRVRASRNSNTGNSGNVRRNSGTSNNASRQPLTARSARQAPSASQANRNRPVVSQRNVASRQATSTRTTSRSSVGQRSTAQRPSSRPSVQRQASARRQTSRPAVQRQAPAQRSTPAAAPQQPSGLRRPASSGNRSSSRNRQPRH